MADIRNMFAKMASQSGEGDAPDPEEAPRPKPKAKPTIEKTYQKKSQLEHILLRPDTYIGSVEKASENMWIYDEDKQAMVQKQIVFVPGLYKIFDEILVNAADNKQRDSKMDCIKIDIRPEENLISVWNNGHGIPVVMHKEENMYVPTMIFGHLLTSSNYNDEEEKVTGGRNGYGAKLCNIFSSKFTVETASKEYKRQFKQTWASNMTKTTEPKIREFSGEEFTKITFSPDLTKFGMDSLDEDIVALMSRRAYDVAASSRGVRVFLNGKRLPIKNFKDYIDLFVKNREEENVKIVYDNPHERWEIGVTPSTVEQGFQQMSFVNSIATTKGGKHVDYIVDMMVKQLLEVIKKKNKGGANIKPLQVKNHMWVFINCLIVNPSFDSQTKENMTLQSKNFGSKVTLNEKFIQQVQKSGLVENVLTWAKFKAETELAKTSGKKQTKLKGIPKLEDANEAGTKNGIKCTLILTEGDSAKTLAVSGLGIVGRDYYGVFPLKGKLLNVREATHKQLLENQEINSLIRIMGLQYKKKYNSVDDMKTLRYGKIMIMTDQDQDGSHIKGLLINFIHYNWPELLRQKFLEVFITPLVKVKKRNEEHCFYSLPEFEEWKSNTPNHKTYSVKYYKGLGTSTAQEAKEYFRNMERHRIPFRYQGPQDDDHIVLAFSKKHIEHRKEWLTNFMVESKRRKELGLPEKYLYTKDRKFVTFTDFVNLELVLFSNADNIRSIPSVVDGLKPGQRKVMFTCFKRNDKKEVKVAQLSGSVAEMSAYHHGEASLCMTIVNLAQNFVGSNNINLLEPRGQFGTRLQGGKDSASPRYIFTKMSPLTRLIFHPADEPLLKHEYDDNQKIEPVWYAPIIPMVLVNGADGIGTGWMTKIPNFNPREIVSNIRLMLDDNEPVDMQPWYKNFTGMIESCGDHRYVVSGEIFTLGDNKVEITELPVLTWTQNYKENVLEPLLCDSDKPSLKGAAKGGKGAGKATKSAEKATKADKTDKESDKSTDKQKFAISDYKEYHTDTTVKFLVTMSPEQLRTMRNEGLHKVFKLQTSISTACMYAFDELGCIKRYESVLDLLGDFYTLRLNMYQKRKDYLEGMLQAEADKLSNQARFILEKCNGTLTVENKKRKIIVEELKRRGYDPDPVATWKEKVKVEQDDEAEDQSQNEGEENEREAAKSTKEGDSDDVKKYDYLLGMSMWMLTDERKSELLRQRDTKLTELEVLRRKSHKDLWRQDLDVFMEKLDKVEEKEREDEQEGSKGKKKGTLGKKKITLKETMPSPMGERIVPAISDEMKKKIQNAIKMRENKGKRAMKKDISAEVEKDEFDLLLEDTRTLKQKLGTPEEPKKGGKRMKQSKLDFKKKEVSVNGSPKKKKKKGGSDSEESINTSGSDSEIEFSGVSSPVVKARVTSRRAATKTIKYDVSEESEASSAEELHENHAVKEDGNHAQRILSDESEDEMPAPRNAPSSEDLFDSLVGRKKSSSPSPDSSEEAAHKRKRIIDDDSEDMFQGNPEPEKKKKTAKAAEKKSKPKKAKRESDDEDFNLPKDDDSDIEMLEGSPPPQKKKASKTNGEKKSKSKKAKKGSGSEDEDFNLPKKKSKKKQVISVSSESEDDDIPPPPKVEREGRNTKKSKYVFDSDSSD